MHYLCSRNKGMVPASLTPLSTMFYNIYFTPSHIDTVNKALRIKEWPNAESLLSKFGEAIKPRESDTGSIIRISSEELDLLKSCIMRWYLLTDVDNRAMLALQVYKTIIEDIAEETWSDEDVDIS